MMTIALNSPLLPRPHLNWYNPPTRTGMYEMQVGSRAPSRTILSEGFAGLAIPFYRTTLRMWGTWLFPAMIGIPCISPICGGALERLGN